MILKIRISFKTPFLQKFQTLILIHSYSSIDGIRGTLKFLASKIDIFISSHFFSVNEKLKKILTGSSDWQTPFFSFVWFPFFP